MAGEGPHIRVLTARIATTQVVRPRLDCARAWEALSYQLPHLEPDQRVSVPQSAVVLVGCAAEGCAAAAPAERYSDRPTVYYNSYCAFVYSACTASLSCDQTEILRDRVRVTLGDGARGHGG